MKKILQNVKAYYKLVLICLIAGLALGWILFHNAGDAGHTSREAQITDGHNHDVEEAVIWTCSMHPQIKQDKPGKCPICAMDLIPLTSMNTGGDDVSPDEIVMSEAAAKLASVQTTIVLRGAPVKNVYLQGKVQADERNIAELTARFGGRIEKLHINFTGQNVRKGDKLATIYSPGLVTAQMELLEAKNSKESRPSLYNAALGKLKLWDLTDKQISDIENRGEPLLFFDVLSPISGTVTMRHVAIGDYIKEGMALFRVIDLTRVWVLFDAYESDLPWIRTGDKVDFTVSALPGKTFNARVSFIDPMINGQTRVAKVRVELANPDLNVKPEMFTYGRLESKIAESGSEILIPRSSVLWTGKRAIVYVKVPDRENPTFLHREITLGPEAGAYFVVAEGLEEGEEIATNGVFKIDAAAQLRGQTSMMNPKGEPLATAYDHSKMLQGNDAAQKSNTVIDPASIPKIFSQQLTLFYKAYLKMKDAFVESDPSKVSSLAAGVITKLGEVDMALLKGETHNKWMELNGELNRNLKAIASKSDLEQQRKDFTVLNNTLYTVVKAFKLQGETVYYQFCPMANADNGGYWFSDSQEIRNPYFGDMMLTCGEVKEVIK